MSARFSSRNSIAAMLAAPLFGAASLAVSGGAFADCAGLPSNTQTKCVKAVQIPGNPIRSFDISWVNPHRAEYYLGDRSNAGIDIIDTRHLTFKRTIGGFVGVVLNPPNSQGVVTVNNNLSGPDGVTSHGRWLYAGDGDSTLKVIDLDAPTAHAIKDSIPTGGSTRVDEMALTSDGELLIAANNAEDPPFATLFRANGDNHVSNVIKLDTITIDLTIVPKGFGLSMEQPTWDPKTKRFYVSVPIIADNPTGCNLNPDAGPITCDGGMLVIDPTSPTVSVPFGAFNSTTNTGVVKLHSCGPNGITVGPHDNLLLGCTPANNPSNTVTNVINATTKHFAHAAGITGSDEVWFNSGDGRYYTGSNRNCRVPGTPCPKAADQVAVLGVIDGTSVLIETIPQSSGSHSVAADSKRNLIFVPQVGPASNPAIGAGGDTTTVGAGICGTNNGCVAVYSHQVDQDKDDHDRDRDRDDHDHHHDHDH
jgi:hypothetical protein